MRRRPASTVSATAISACGSRPQAPSAPHCATRASACGSMRPQPNSSLAMAGAPTSSAAAAAQASAQASANALRTAVRVAAADRAAASALAMAGQGQRRHQLDRQHQRQLDQLPCVVEGGQCALAGLRRDGARRKGQAPAADRPTSAAHSQTGAGGSPACAAAVRGLRHRARRAPTQPSQPQQHRAQQPGAQPAHRRRPAQAQPPQRWRRSASTLTTRLAEYMPVKSRSCCRRVVQRQPAGRRAMPARSTPGLRHAAADQGSRQPAGQPADRRPAQQHEQQRQHAAPAASRPHADPALGRPRPGRATGRPRPAPARRPGAPLASTPASQSGKVSISTTTSARPEVPKAAACADSRASPSSRLASSRARDKAPAFRNMAVNYRARPGRPRAKT